MESEAKLSPREIEVMRAYAAHLSSEEIRDRLGIELGTIRKYLHTARSKLGGRNKREAIHRFLDLYGDEPPTKRSTANDCEDVLPFDHADGYPAGWGAESSLNDVAVDHAPTKYLEDRSSTAGQTLGDLLRDVKPEALSLAARNALILASIVVAGATFFVINVAAAALMPLAHAVRALFP